MSLTDHRHIRGFLGEQDAGFAFGHRNFDALEGPSGSFDDETCDGSGGHRITAPGFDAVLIGKESKHIIFLDNKAYVTDGDIASASAIDENRVKNLEAFIDRVPSLAYPDTGHVLHELSLELKSLKDGGPGSDYVHWCVTAEYGPGVSGVSDRLNDRDIKYLDLSKATNEWDVIAQLDQSREVQDKAQEARQQVDSDREIAEAKDRGLLAEGRQREMEARETDAREDRVRQEKCDSDRQAREQRQIEDQQEGMEGYHGEAPEERVREEKTEIEHYTRDALLAEERQKELEARDREARDERVREEKTETECEPQEKAVPEGNEESDQEQATDRRQTLAIGLDPEQLAAETRAGNTDTHDVDTRGADAVSDASAITELGSGVEGWGWFGRGSEHS